LSDTQKIPSLFDTELDLLNKSKHYVTEEELRVEINNIQQSQYLDELLAIEEPTSEDLSEITRLKDEGYISKYSKEKFGVMILRIVHRLSKRGNFAGYTEGWKMDFYSNALEKILSYAINNIDLEMISPRSGERVKVFAYITQIASNAFIEIINKRKQEQSDMMEYIIPFEDFYDHVKKYYNPVYDKKVDDKEKPDVKLVCVRDDDSLYKFTTEDDLTIGYKVVKVSDNDELDVDVCDFNNINGVFEVLKGFRESTNKIQFVFPLEYTMSFDEYTEITLLNYDFLNVTKVEKERYMPSFPKKQKKIREDKFEEWEA
jgi:hypothetical protein